MNLFNSIYVTAATVLITTVCAVLAGYALVHIKPVGAGLVVTALLVSLYFPVRVVSIISIYQTQHWLGLINNTSGLILPYITLQLAISILIMRSMFQLVPHEMFESARVDGAGHWRALWEIGLPMVRNGLVVIFIVNFVAAWGEYLFCLTLVDETKHDAGGSRRRPRRAGAWAWPNLAAVYVIVVTPGIIAFTLARGCSSGSHGRGAEGEPCKRFCGTAFREHRATFKTVVAITGAAGGWPGPVPIVPRQGAKIAAIDKKASLVSD